MSAPSVVVIREALACTRPGCLCWRAKSKTHCPAHDDRHPSLDVTDRAGRTLVICRAGCRQADVLAALRARGLWLNRPAPAPSPQASRSPLEEARARVLAEARRQQARLEPYRDVFAVSDFIRVRFHFADRAWRVATVLGPSERVWDLLARAARVESQALAAEVQADAMLAEGPLS